MALIDYEVELQTEIIAWKESRNRDCVMEFIPQLHHIKLVMEGLLWSIEAKPISGRASRDINQYTFTVMDVKRSATPLSLSYAKQPELPPKLELLLLGFKISMKSVFKAEEALDKLHKFSRLFSETEKDQRWWIIVDAEIAATACVTAREAVQEAAIAAAAFLPPPPLNPTSSENVEASSTDFQKRERASEGWTTADELWAASFSERSDEVRKRLEFLSVATERGDVLQWCTVNVIGSPLPSFEIVVELDHFLNGDDVVMRIGVFSHVALKVRVSRTEDNVEVVCSQEGVETKSSLCLGYVLPVLVRDYIESDAKTCTNGLNVVEGLLRCVVRYLGLLRRKCVVCGGDRLFPVPPTSACDNICKARKKRYDDLVARRRDTSEEEKEFRRREEYVRAMYPNTWQGRKAAERVVGVRVVEGKRGFEAAPKKGRAEEEEGLEYVEAVMRIAKMTWSKVAKATGNSMVGLWKED